MRTKKKYVYSILIAMVLIVFTGCNLSDTVKEIKMEPGVMDISINTYKNSVKVGVILNSNVDFTTTEDLAEKYALIVKKYYKKRDIYLRIIQNKEELSSYSIEILFKK
ncbi:hypothetical protein [Clostridium sp.]|uniref:hypothetical protein n=1 Tax=Clostridium sp. TaxID=1506 RepID=UPI003D6D7188